MDKELFEQYTALRLAHADLKKRISRMQRELNLLRTSQVADTVTGSREDLTVGPIKVVGKPTKQYHELKRRYTALINRYNNKAKELADKLEEVEKYLDGIEDERLCTILRLRYIDGKPWSEVGLPIGISGDGCRMIVERYFKNC